MIIYCLHEYLQITYILLHRGETVSLLLETILTAEKVESSIVGGIQVLLVLLGQRTSKYDVFIYILQYYKITFYK